MVLNAVKSQLTGGVLIRDGLYILTHIFAIAYIVFMKAQALFDVLVDATRRRILALLLAKGELCVCELMAALDVIQPKVSRHLGVIKDAELVLARREGTWMHYRLAPLPAWVVDLLTAMSRGGAPALKSDLKRLKAMGARPERLAA